MLASAHAETDDTDAYRARSGFRRREAGQHTSSGVLTFVEVSQVYVESALHAFYPRLKGIRSSANFIQNIVSKYLGEVSRRASPAAMEDPPNADAL